MSEANSRIEAENAKLRGENELLSWANRRYEGGEVSLKTDIARLHALVRDMWTCVMRHEEYLNSYGEIESPCAGCPMLGDERCDFEGRMQGLAVEVEE